MQVKVTSAARRLPVLRLLLVLFSATATALALQCGPQLTRAVTPSQLPLKADCRVRTECRGRATVTATYTTTVPLAVRYSSKCAVIQ